VQEWFGSDNKKDCSHWKLISIDAEKNLSSCLEIGARLKCLWKQK